MRADALPEAADQGDAFRAKRLHGARQRRYGGGGGGYGGAPDRIASGRRLKRQRREGAIVAGLGGQRPLQGGIGVVAKAQHQGSGERRRRLQSVLRAQSGADRIGADTRGRAVVAEQKAAPADDGFLAGDAGDAGRSGAGDDKAAVGARMRAKTGGDS